MTKVREENNAGGRGRKHRGRPGGGPRTACPPGSLGQGRLPKSAGTAPGIRNSMCKSPEVRKCWMCLRRRPVWPDPSGQGDRVASVVRDMGGGRSGCTSSWESLAQDWGQRLFENPGRRGPHFKHACIHSFIHHLFIVSFIVIHHSFPFSHSDSLIFYLFIHLLLFIIHSLSFIRHSVNPHSAACSGDESDPSLPTLKGPRCWGGGGQARKRTEGQLGYLFYPQGGFHSPGLPGWAACGCNGAVCG